MRLLSLTAKLISLPWLSLPPPGVSSLLCTPGDISILRRHLKAAPIWRTTKSWTGRAPYHVFGTGCELRARKPPRGGGIFAGSRGNDGVAPTADLRLPAKANYREAPRLRQTHAVAGPFP